MKRMQGRMVFGLVMVLALGGTGVAETEYKLERYNVILDRSPFGPVQPINDPSTDISVEAPITAAELEKAYRLSYLYESESGEVQAGFQNLKPSPGEPLSSIVMLGESFMGMQLKSVDVANSEATLSHNGQLIPFRLTRQKSSAKAASMKPAISQRKFDGGFHPFQPSNSPQPQLSPAEQQKRREEVRKNLQSYQMEVIRKGMPPLPVPLTQEMDEQLVSEGVLPSPQ